MPLLRSDFQSRTWDHFKEHLEARLQRLREENDSGDADATAKRRGRIAEVKELLALGDEAQHGEDER